MLFSLIEPLESRIAPASLISSSAVSFTDKSGDIVTVSFSKSIFSGKNGLILANEIFTFDTGMVNSKSKAIDPTEEALAEINLTKDPAAAGTSITVTVKNGADEASIGYIDAIGLNLGNVSIKGNLERIDAGGYGQSIDNLTVDSFGVAGSFTTSNIAGSVKSFHVTGNSAHSVAGNITDAQINFGAVGRGSIGSLEVAGSLVGSSDNDSADITFTGSITTAKIGGALEGNSGSNSGSLQGDGVNSYIDSLAVAGAVTGGGGADSGQISASAIRTLTIGGSLLGGAGLDSGQLSGGEMSTVSITGNVQGGTAGQDAKTTPAMVAAVAGHSGAILATDIGALTIGGSVIGGVYTSPTQNAQESGEIVASGAIGKLIIKGNVTADSTSSTGALDSAWVSAATINSLTVDGSLTGGTGADSGQIHYTTSLGKAVIGETSVSASGNVTGGAGASSGVILGDSGSTLNSLTLQGNLVGGAGFNSGQINGDTLSTVIIAGNVQGGTAGQDKVTGQNAAPAVAGHSGAILATEIGAVTIDGSLIGGVYTSATQNAQESGEIVASDTISTLTIKGSITADSTSAAGAVDSAWVSAANITTLAVDGSVTGGTGSDSGQVHFSSSLGTATIGQSGVSSSGSVTGGAGASSGVILGDSGSTLTKLTLDGNLVGGAGMNSGQINGDTLSTVTIAGNVQGGTAGQDAVAAQTGPPVVSATPAVAGHSGAVLATNITTLTIGGSLIGGVYGSATQNAQESGEIVATDTISSLTINGSITADSTSATGAVDSAWVSAAAISSLTVDGSVTGGTGADSGQIHYSSSLGTATIGNSSVSSSGNVTGGAGASSGVILGDSGSTLTKLTLDGNLVGGAGFGSGHITGGTLTTVTINGDVDSGSIRAGTEIVSLTIDGNVQGSSTSSVYITAAGQGANLASTATTDVAIGTLTIKGNIDQAEILAGYGTDATADAPRGTPTDPDAQIGTVTISKNLSATSIVAGADPGGDLQFGNSDDTKISASSPNSTVIASIASIIVTGTASGADDNGSTHYGFDSRQVESVTIDDAAYTIPSGSDNGSIQTIDSTLSIFEV